MSRQRRRKDSLGSDYDEPMLSALLSELTRAVSTDDRIAPETYFMFLQSAQKVLDRALNEESSWKNPRLTLYPSERDRYPRDGGSDKAISSERTPPPSFV